jgi:hypothetical protein
MMLTPLFIKYFYYFDFIFMLLFFLYTINMRALASSLWYKMCT